MSRLALALLAACLATVSWECAAVADSAKPRSSKHGASDADRASLDAPPAPAAKPGPAKPGSKQGGSDAADPSGAVYQGVAPGGSGLPPHPPKLPVKGPARVIWPGFQVRDGVPTVFVEVTGPVEWSVEEKPHELVYTLKNTIIPLRNNQRPLRVGEFGTAIQKVDARSKGRDVRLTIATRQPVSHKERTEEAAGGFKMLVVELTARE
jgi:AMIN domain-containing protein